MKTKHFLVIFVVLFLIFVGIWIISPRVGEKVNPDEGTNISFENRDDELPERLPDGFVRVSSIQDAVVYRQDNGDGTATFYEYVGDEKFVHYDANRPLYFAKTSFDRSLYQVKNADGSLREEYRFFDGEKWLIVNKDREKAIELPNNYHLVGSTINLYLVKNDEEISFKLLSKIGSQYVWLSPLETEEWIETTIPDTFKKTSIPNVYEGKDGDKAIFKKVLSFDDKQKTVAVVSCDKDGKFI